MRQGVGHVEKERHVGLALFLDKIEPFLGEAVMNVDFALSRIFRVFLLLIIPPDPLRIVAVSPTLVEVTKEKIKTLKGILELPDLPMQPIHRKLRQLGWIGW